MSRETADAPRLTPAEIESLRKDSELSLQIGRVLRAREQAISRGANAAELAKLKAKLKALETENEGE